MKDCCSSIMLDNDFLFTMPLRHVFGFCRPRVKTTTSWPSRLPKISGFGFRLLRGTLPRSSITGVPKELISGSPVRLRSLGTDDLYSIDWVAQSEPRWSACWTCLIRDLVVSFSIEPARLVSPVRMLLQHLEVENIDPQTRFEIRAISQDGGVLIQDGIERMRASHPGAFKDSVHKAILETLHTGVEWLALIHGGALAFNRIGIGFPAPTGSGKSTLIAYLAKNGFKYFSDDILPITAPAGVILPWPLPLSIKSGSWEILLPLYPDLSRSPVFFTKGDRARLLKPCPTLWYQEPVPLRYLVFPHFNPTAPNGLQTIPPLEVFEQLIRENTWLGHPLDKRRIEAFLDWLRGIPAFALTYKNLPEAARCLEELLTSGASQ